MSGTSCASASPPPLRVGSIGMTPVLWHGKQARSGATAPHQGVLRPRLLTPEPAPARWPCPPSPARQQELDNLLQEKRYLRALGLAISLDRPHTVLTVIQGQCYLRGLTGGSGGVFLWGPSCPFPGAYLSSSHSHS